MRRRDFLKRVGTWSAVVGALPLVVPNTGGCTDDGDYQDYGDHDPCDPTYEDSYDDCWEYQEMYEDYYSNYNNYQDAGYSEYDDAP